MNITEVIVKMAGPEDPGRPRLLAYATIVLEDAFAVHDLKVIDGRDGLFVAMPSKTAPVKCQCGRRHVIPERVGETLFVKRGNEFVALGRDCPDCGEPLPQPERGRRFLDIAHPISRSVRADIERVVMDEFKAARERDTARSGGAPSCGST